MENKKNVVKSWLETASGISKDIKNAVISEWCRRDKGKDKIFVDLANPKPLEELPNVRDEDVLDLCHAVKSVLTMINFGELKTIDATDEEFVKRGVWALVEYFENEEKGYNKITQLNYDYCVDTFGEPSQVYINRTMASVMVTFTYFCRARKLLNKDAQVKVLEARIANCMQKILRVWLATVEKNGYKGWGFMSTSLETTLADTYRVVEAISKYQDAFDKNSAKEEEFKDFTALVNGEENLTERIEDAMYRVGLNIYDETARDCYGEGIFYVASNYEMDGKAGKYRRCDMGQILSSNRSSALFQPLYVALITMFGYTDKEVIIRKLMTSPNAVKNVYEALMTEIGDNESRVEDVEALKNLYENFRYITKEHPLIAELDGKPEWKQLYDEARQFEKAIERYAENEMTVIKEYRDYLNKTKEAIDDVQVYYRKFSDSQKLGIVDTDYTIFSNQDVVDAGAVEISRLNKSNIITAYLRPLLLSAKIMIVNALIGYPQSDMESLYMDIMNSVYRKRTRDNKIVKEMLWNEEEKDMYATACNCDAVAYDYFDYYNRYELNYRLASCIQEETQRYIKGSFTLDNDELDFEKAQAAVMQNTGLHADDKNADIVAMIFDVAQSQIRALHEEYSRELKELMQKHSAEIGEKKEEIERIEKKRSDESEVFNKEKAELVKESEISRIIQETIDRKVNESFENILGGITLLNYTRMDKFNGEMLTNYEEEDALPASAQAALAQLRKDTKEMSEDDAHAYMRAKSDQLKAFRNMFETALDGNLLAVRKLPNEADASVSRKAKLAERFAVEKKKFDGTWLEKTVIEDVDKNNKYSLENVFTACEQQDIYILTTVKPEKKN